MQRPISMASRWISGSIAIGWFLVACTADATPLVPFEREPAASATQETFRAIARSEAARAGIPYELVDAVMRVESAYNPAASGADGEVGLMQVMPPTARMLGFTGTGTELADPQVNIRLGTTYLAEAWRLANKDICTTVMKYRAGWNETRFSVLSVRYCVRVRNHLLALGYPVTGEVPVATFGFATDAFAQGVAITTKVALRNRRLGRKIRQKVDWTQYERRMKELNARGRISIAE